MSENLGLFIKFAAGLIEYWLLYKLENLPFAAKLAIANFFVFPMVFMIAPPPVHVPVIFLPLLWMGGYCIALAVTAVVSMFAPLRSPGKFHWVQWRPEYGGQAPLDDVRDTFSAPNLDYAYAMVELIEGIGFDGEVDQADADFFQRLTAEHIPRETRWRSLAWRIRTDQERLAC